MNQSVQIREHLLSLLKARDKKGVGNFIGSSSVAFTELIHLAISDSTDYCWHAAWMIQSHVHKNDIRLKPYIPDFLEAIKSKKDGHQRELLKVLFKTKLNEEQEAQLYDICLSLWQNIYKQGSVRHTAFMFLAVMAKKYPDLLNEIKLVCDEPFLKPLTHGIRHGVTKRLRELGVNIS